MMRVLSLACLSFVLWALPSKAAPYGMAGCGLGSLLIKSDDFLQIFAVTMNGISGNQTMAISMGSSNCVPASKMAAIMKQENFVKHNLNSLYIEMARGDGEVLKAFAATLGCSQAAYPVVSATTRSAFKAIFQAPGALAVLQEAKTHLKANSYLNEQCQHLS